MWGVFASTTCWLVFAAVCDSLNHIVKQTRLTQLAQEGVGVDLASLRDLLAFKALDNRLNFPGIAQRDLLALRLASQEGLDLVAGLACEFAKGTGQDRGACHAIRLAFNTPLAVIEAVDEFVNCQHAVIGVIQS